MVIVSKNVMKIFQSFGFSWKQSKPFLIKEKQILGIV